MRGPMLRNEPARRAPGPGADLPNLVIRQRPFDLGSRRVVSRKIFMVFRNPDRFLLESLHYYRATASHRHNRHRKLQSGGPVAAPDDGSRPWLAISEHPASANQRLSCECQTLRHARAWVSPARRRLWRAELAHSTRPPRGRIAEKSALRSGHRTPWMPADLRPAFVPGQVQHQVAGQPGFVPQSRIRPAEVRDPPRLPGWREEDRPVRAGAAGLIREGVFPGTAERVTTWNGRSAVHASRWRSANTKDSVEPVSLFVRRAESDFTNHAARRIGPLHWLRC